MSAQMTTAPTSPSSDSTLSQILRADPLTRGLQRLRFNPTGFGLLILAYAVLHTLVLPAIYGHLITAHGVMGVLEDWPYLVILLVMTPLLASYYLWQPETIRTLYRRIAERIGENPAAEKRAAELARPLGWPGWMWIAGLAGLAQVWFWVDDLSHRTFLSWQTVNKLMIVSGQPLRFLGFYVLVFILARQVVVLIGLNRFFTEFQVEVAPLHPDRAGGLRPLGDYVLTTGFFVAVISLNFGMTFLRAQTNLEVMTAEFYGELAVYFILAPLLFLLPLLSVHSLMQAAKRKLLAEIAEQFDKEYRVLLDNLRRDVLNPEGVARLEAVQKIYQIAQTAPVWPFDLEIVSKFGAAIFLPILAPLGVELVANILAR